VDAIVRAESTSLEIEGPSDDLIVHGEQRGECQVRLPREPIDRARTPREFDVLDFLDDGGRNPPVGFALRHGLEDLQAGVAVLRWHGGVDDDVRIDQEGQRRARRPIR